MGVRFEQVSLSAWDKSNAYQIGTKVKCGDYMYVAKKDVPKGINIGMSDYWKKMDDLSSLDTRLDTAEGKISALETNVGAIATCITTEVDETPVVFQFAYRDGEYGYMVNDEFHAFSSGGGGTEIYNLKQLVKNQGISSQTYSATGFSGNINTDLINHLTQYLGGNDILDYKLNNAGPVTYDYTTDTVTADTTDMHIAIPLRDMGMLGDCYKVEFDWEHTSGSGSYNYAEVGIYRVNDQANALVEVGKTRCSATNKYTITFNSWTGGTLYLCVTSFEISYVLNHVKFYFG